MTNDLRSPCNPLVWVLAAGAVACASAPKDPKIPESRFAAFEGSRVHYQEYGHGKEALVFVHGWSGSGEVWNRQAAYFAGRVPVLVVDLIGHGRSDAPKTNYSFATMARSIEAVMRDAGVERAVLVGHSNGMPTIREFYRLFPAKTLALVDVDGTLRPFFRDAKEAEPFLAMFQSPKYKETVEQFIRQTFSPKLPEESQQKILATALATPQHVLIGTMQANLDPEVWKDDPIEVPFLLLLAKQEFWEGDYQQYVMKLAPQAEWHMDDGLGHFIQLETPDTVNERIAAFLAKNRLL